MSSIGMPVHIIEQGQNGSETFQGCAGLSDKAGFKQNDESNSSVAWPPSTMYFKRGYVLH